jgi:hypothetical protein
VLLEFDLDAAGIADDGQFGQSWHPEDPFEW